VTELHVARSTTDAVVYNLDAAELVVGDGEKPDAGGWQGSPGSSTFVGYVVVHPIPGGTTDGTLEAPEERAEALYQLSAVGATRQQAEFIADRTREVMLQWPLVIAGRVVDLVSTDTLGGAVRDDAGQPPLYQVADRYRITTEPA